MWSMSRSIIRQLKTLKHAEVNPNEQWLQHNRGLLLSQINNTVSPKFSKFNFENIWQGMSIFLPTSFVYGIVRPVIALALIFSLGAGGWIATVDASYEALPGDWLYSTKRATEQTQVAMATVVGAKNTETKLHAEFAKRRAVETKKIISDPARIKMAAATIKDLKSEMQTVSNKLEEIKTQKVEASAEAAKDINQSAEQINSVLKEVKANLLISPTTSVTDNLSTQVGEAKDLAKDTAVKAAEVMVVKHLEGDNSVSKDEVKQVINDQLQSTIKDVGESRQNAQDVNTAVDVAKTEVKEMVRDAKIGSEAKSNALDLSNKIEAASKQIQEAADKTKQFSNEADQKISESQQLLSQDNFAGAVDKVKEAVDATKKAVRLTDNTKKVAQTVLPVVAVVKEAPLSSTTGIFVTTTPSTTAGMTIVNSSTAIIIKIPTSTKTSSTSLPAASTNTQSK